MIVWGSGHRPDKLGGYGLAVQDKLTELASNALHGLRPRVTRVISGGALGWDQAFARAALEHFPLSMYLPFRDFDCKWPSDSRYQLEKLCKAADEVRYVCEDGYAPWKMQKRNEAMVDDGEWGLVLWNGTAGGTQNCLRYADKIGKQYDNLWSEFK